MYFDAKEVDNLRQVYNEEHKHERPIQGGNPEHVWIEIRKRLSKACKSGRAECIISHMLQKPAGPSSWRVNPEEWITSDDIDSLEKRFEKMFNEYKHVGTFPISIVKQGNV